MANGKFRVSQMYTVGFTTFNLNVMLDHFFVLAGEAVREIQQASGNK